MEKSFAGGNCVPKRPRPPHHTILYLLCLYHYFSGFIYLFCSCFLVFLDILFTFKNSNLIITFVKVRVSILDRPWVIIIPCEVGSQHTFGYSFIYSFSLLRYIFHVRENREWPV